MFYGVSVERKGVGVASGARGDDEGLSFGGCFGPGHEGSVIARGFVVQSREINVFLSLFRLHLISHLLHSLCSVLSGLTLQRC